MRAVVQRVAWARVRVDSEIVGAIEHGALVLVAAGRGDSAADVTYLSQKVLGLRIFPDEQGAMNCALGDRPDSGLLVVSQFTLYGDCRRGRRPSFIAAEEPERAEKLYDDFVAACRDKHSRVAAGRFRAMMQVELCNDGPVTVLVDSQKLF